MTVSLAILALWFPGGSHQAPLVHTRWQHHGGPEICLRYGRRGPWTCELLDPARRSIQP